MDSFENTQLTTNRMESYRPDFSFNKCDEKQLSKYGSLSNQLAKLQTNELIELLMDEIEQNQKSKQQLFLTNNTIHKLREELKEIQVILCKKRQTISLLCQTETNNINLIEKLEMKLKHTLDIDQDSYYEAKYHQLTKYMGEYINNINQAQDQFKRKYNLLKNQNTRLHQQVQKLNSQSIQVFKKYQILIHQFKQIENAFNSFRQKETLLEQEIITITQENQNLKKQIEICHQNIKITDRIQSRSDNQISSQLDFIREKINQNQSISRDIIVKYEEKHQKYQKIIHQKQQLSTQFHQISQRNKIYEIKIKQLQFQICTLKKKNQRYLQEIQTLEKQIYSLKTQIIQTNQQYQSENRQKQQIKGQLIKLAEQVKRMEGIYQRQIQQSQKIKQQLQNFWIKKQKKDNFSILKEKNNTNNKSIQDSNGHSSTCDNSNYKNISIKIRKNNHQNDNQY